ncbi:hypothetical protein [Fidelibacter multiformis]|uniref:hypothetical protein n=1 Tax=Fidelibacter multiformis TaxID=3377529 RepID=UPI0037DD49D6
MLEKQGYSRYLKVQGVTMIIQPDTYPVLSDFNRWVDFILFLRTSDDIRNSVSHKKGGVLCGKHGLM